MRTLQERVEELVQRWSQGLGLTPDQQASLRSIVEAREKEVDALRSQRPGGKGPDEAFRAEVRAIRQKHGPALRKLLTREQQQKLRDLRQEWRAARADDED